MKGHGTSGRLLTILLSGLTLGAIALLEPLIKFWGGFHLLGMEGPRLILLYLGAGLACALIAGLIVSIGLATRAMERRPVVFASYYFAGTFGLAAVLTAAPLLHKELAEKMNTEVSYAIIFLALIVLAALAVAKLTPHLVQPVFSHLIGYPSGRISRPRLVAILVLIGAIIPVTAVREAQDRYRPMGRPPRTEFRSRPSDQRIQNLLLITVDALRPDHLGTYGYQRPTSPVIDSLAARATLFEHCIAQANCTELSMGALFTSLYPSMHAVRREGHIASRLPEGIETLAEVMRDAGLQTVGLMSNPYLKREWGLTQGFDGVDEFHDSYLDLMPMRYMLRLGLVPTPKRIPGTQIPRAEVVVDRAIDFLAQAHERPFFLFVHFMDVHHPYFPPHPYQDAFRSPGASETLPERLWTKRWSVFNMLPDNPDALARSDLLRVIDLYDGAIRYVDDQLGRLLGELDRLGLAENTLVILSADHGDEFLEHGDIFHKSPFLYDELVHVPLVIRSPEIKNARRVDRIVRHIDLMPTAMEVFDLPTGKSLQGQSLMPLLTGLEEWSPVAAFSQSYQFIAMRTPGHKLMYDLANSRGYCFDLLADPNETQNLYGDSVQVTCDSMEVVLMEFFRKVSVSSQGTVGEELDPRTQRVLKSLGYIDF